MLSIPYSLTIFRALPALYLGLQSRLHKLMSVMLYGHQDLLETELVL